MDAKTLSKKELNKTLIVEVFLIQVQVSYHYLLKISEKWDF